MAQIPSRPHNRHAFKIAVICALSTEASMVEATFDKFWHGVYGKAYGDSNSYTLGMIGKHNVVLAHMPSMGSNSAAMVAAGLRSSFHDIEIAFVVGICGAVPYQMQEIVLGDCIISTAVVQYDFGKQYPHEFIEKNAVQDSLGRASARIRSLTSMLTTSLNQEWLTERLVYHLKALQEKTDVQYPGWQRDRLFQPSYAHRHQDGSTCGSCLDDTGVCSKDCDAIGCVADQLVQRNRYENLQPSAIYSPPRIHFGRFGSANTVMKSGWHRDQIAAKDELIALEMEGSGVWDVFPTIVIKSACDYADSHKSKEWQPYAAATAAAGLKALLERHEVSDGSPNHDRYGIKFSLRGLPVTKDFIARPAEMQHIQQSLLPDLDKLSSGRRKIYVLRGLGGIGKTQMAIEFMRQYHSRFSAVLWLDGSTEDNLKRSLAGYASKIAPDQISEASKAFARSGGDINDVVKEVLQWLALEDNSSWLIVFDNVDREFDPRRPDPLSYDIEWYFPDADHGAILITTRLARMEQMGEFQEVEKVNSDTAQAILRSWYRRSYDPDDGRQLLELLDGLPLAITQAGAYLQESGTDIKTYLRFYEETQRDVERMIDCQVYLRDYPNRSVWTTWNISYESIVAQDKYVAHLLVLWSFLSRSDLWYGIFEKAAAWSEGAREALSRWLGEIAYQEESFRNAMHLLRRYSLIESPLETYGYAMHAVVHRWAYSYRGLNHLEDLGLLALAVVGLTIPTNDQREYAWLQRRLLPHAQTCTTRVFSNEAANTQKPDLFAGWTGKQEYVLDAIHLLSMLYRDQGKFDESEKMYLRALQGKEEALGVKHLSTLTTVHKLGSLYLDQGKLDVAQKMYLRALQGEEALGAKHTSTLDTIHDLAGLYKAQGKPDEAGKMYLQALQGKEEALGAKHPSTLDTINNLANFHKDHGKPDEAEKMYLQALRGKEEVLGAKHPSTLNTVHELGDLYKAQGKLDVAEKMYVQALQGKEEALEAKHPSTLDTINNLGGLYKDQGRLDEAEKMYLRALQGKEEALGAKHPSTHNTVHELASLYKSHNKLDEAEKMYLRALRGKEEALGVKHISTLITVNDLPNLHKDQGKLDEAEKMYLRALRGYEEALNVELVQTCIPALDNMRDLGILYSQIPSKITECREMYIKALSGYTRVYGPSSGACLYLQSQLDTLDGTTQSDDMNPHLSTNSTEANPVT